MDHDSFVLPLRILRQADHDALANDGKTVLPLSTSGGILRVMDSVSGLECDLGHDLAQLASAITLAWTTVADVDLDTYGAAARDGDFVIAWQAIPVRHRFRPRIVNAATCWIERKGANHALMLSSFLLWFKKVYCEQIPNYRVGIVRIGFSFLTEGVVVAILCDDAVGLPTNTLRHNITPRVIDVANRLLVAASTDDSASEDELRICMAFTRAMLGRVGFE